ncbi:phenolic glucoside malonyltransferase 1-like [Lolium rigidum]|uniref:phenolic glucoside malonyltransferase 1-like n=1 Tax=Lolium rigidum TaxID=89674 RepID=UPI001F5C4476|nr:phenolic glucoside malonyltransferase 1-like [Lolium rigidum]
MAPVPELSVLESAVVAPSSPAPETTCSLRLNFFDVFWLNSPPVERVFFYRLTPGTGDDITSILSNIKSSLSQALGAFYPLAGRLRLTPATDDRYELHYQPGDGVTFTVAEYEADVDELAEDEPTEVAKILPLVPPLPVGVGPVLSVQATVLRGGRGRGLAIGLALHHAACDGASSTRFLHTWAAAAGTGTGAPPPPVMDRTLVDDPSGGCPLYKLLSTDEMEYVKMADDQLVATFTLSKEDIQRVKDVVVAAAGARPPRCTSLVATFGFIWSCYQRSKDDAASSSEQTHFIFPIDQRSRMKPDPIPDEYFGNCVGAAMEAAAKNQLAAAGADGLLAACTAIAAAIERAVGELGSPEKMALWMERIREASASGGGVLTVAGSPRFRVYDVDFGFGRPAKVEIVSVARTGAMAVAESRQSGGGMEVGMSLPPAGMQRFQTCFHDAITWLHQQ